MGSESGLLYFLCKLETEPVRVGSIVGMVHGIEKGVWGWRVALGFALGLQRMGFSFVGMQMGL